MSKRIVAWISLGGMLILGGLVTVAQDEGGSNDKVKNRPLVRVVSPEGVCFVPPGSSSKMLISVEVVDVAGTGIQSDDSGIPRFFGNNRNAEILRSNILSKGSYTNSHNQTVVQLLSNVPLDGLVMDGQKITPPIDYLSLTPGDLEKGFEIPSKLAVDFAAFEFSVVDKRGVSSMMGDRPILIIGFASSPYAPPHR